MSQPVIVSGDKLRLQQILTNLLNNAVKFTETGRVGVALDVEPSSDGAVNVRIEVSDTGVGFDMGRKDLVFGRFTQADGGITRRFGGSGLGMAISRQLANLMSAELDCRSVMGAGSTFTLALTLPLCEAATLPSASARSEPSDEAQRRSLQVLLVDDHPTNRKVCELILAQIDAVVVSAEDGQQAVDAFNAGAFDVVLMDMQMPVMDGLTAVRHIRAFEAATGQARTPIFMLTANALPEHIAQGADAGADHHIAKPVTSASLFEALASLDGDGAVHDEEHQAA